MHVLIHDEVSAARFIGDHQLIPPQMRVRPSRTIVLAQPIPCDLRALSSERISATPVKLTGDLKVDYFRSEGVRQEKRDSSDENILGGFVARDLAFFRSSQGSS